MFIFVDGVGSLNTFSSNSSRINWKNTLASYSSMASANMKVELCAKSTVVATMVLPVEDGPVM